MFVSELITMVLSLSLHCLALHFRDSVFSLSLHLDFVLRGGGEEGSGWPATEQLRVLVLSSFVL
jgi:hypothetical protein